MEKENGEKFMKPIHMLCISIDSHVLAIDLDFRLLECMYTISKLFCKMEVCVLVLGLEIL